MDTKSASEFATSVPIDEEEYLECSTLGVEKDRVYKSKILAAIQEFLTQNNLHDVLVKKPKKAKVAANPKASSSGKNHVVDLVDNFDEFDDDIDWSSIPETKTSSTKSPYFQPPSSLDQFRFEDTGSGSAPAGNSSGNPPKNPYAR